MTMLKVARIFHEEPRICSMIKVSQILIAYITEMPGHKDSHGDTAPYVIKSHETDKILSSHATREEAKKHLKQMHIFGD